MVLFKSYHKYLAFLTGFTTFLVFLLVYSCHVISQYYNWLSQEILTSEIVLEWFLFVVICSLVVCSVAVLLYVIHQDWMQLKLMFKKGK